MSGFKTRVESVKAPLGMVLVQFFTTGMMILSKMVLDKGTFILAFLTYRNAVGAIFVAPFAIILERGAARKLSWLAFLWIFINAMLGISMAMVFYYYGLRDTTATYSTNFINLIPIATFIFAVLARIEKLELGSRAGKVKILGTLLCVAGVMVVSLYKGKTLNIWPSHMEHHHTLAEGIVQHHWIRGTLLLMGACMSYALWFIVQVKLFPVYPFTYWVTMLTCLAGCFQTLILGILINRDDKAWRLKWDLQLLTIIYTGALNTGATFCLITWVTAQRGPTYPPMFNCLAMIFTTVTESLLMGEQITVGSILGMCLIIGGLYGFLWGKRKGLPSQKTNTTDLQPRHKSRPPQPLISSSSVSNGGEELSSVMVIGSEENTVSKVDKEVKDGHTYEVF